MAIAHPRAKLITCIVPAGEGFDVASGLNQRFGLTRIGVIHGRGASQRSGTFADEMDILNVVAEPEEAETVFAWLYEAIGIETTPNRFMFQLALDAASAYLLPELPGPAP